MKKLLPAISIAVLLVSTIATGWLQGSLANRWGPPPTTNKAADELHRALLPEVGNWRVRHEGEISRDVLEMLQSPASIFRVYEHQQTGDLITLMVVLGPTGPISVHTPEICYSSRDYTLDGERHKIVLKNNQGDDHTLWDLSLKSNREGTPLRVLYGWTSGTHWDAAQYARYSYGALPHLYKLQLTVSTSSVARSSDFDPARDFLVNFLPQLGSYLVEASP